MAAYAAAAQADRERADTVFTPTVTRSSCGRGELKRGS